ncbi:unnamed protein product [Staurois parvus]|uniref:THD domain-containing protein n=1 Tax=Staurois parvus TaxID=386267 RepID=A0ABN9G5R3_9NEOB|nr:unnamed protein product [Staurois parvus]
MERDPEVGDMLRDRDQRLIQDGRLRRLQWAVTGCAVCLVALLGLTVYQMSQRPAPPSTDKVERSPQISGPSQNFKDTKPRAHLTGKSQYNAKPKDTFLQWESNFGLAYVKDDMQYADKSIHIPKNGYYFVYSQVSLKIPSNFGDHFVSQIIRLNENYGAPEVLFSGKIRKDGQQTIYLAGLLQLNKNDWLKVNVTAVDQVDISSDDKTFFGAFWVMDSTGR